MVPSCVKIYICSLQCREKIIRAAQDANLSVVGDTPVDVLHPLATHGAEAYLQLLRDHITAETQPAAHLHQRVVITRQRLQDLVRERANKGRDDSLIRKCL